MVKYKLKPWEKNRLRKALVNVVAKANKEAEKIGVSPLSLLEAAVKVQMIREPPPKGRLENYLRG